MRYDRMSPEGISTDDAHVCAIDAVKRNPVYRIFVTQQGLDIMQFDYFEGNTSVFSLQQCTYTCQKPIVCTYVGCLIVIDDVAVVCQL